jgi:(1->4)-alpha-D-glucan 1-alpha-D-glucosylmutase
VLSEPPQLGPRPAALAGWAQLYLTRRPRPASPSRNDIWLLFQTLVGLWPAQPPHAQEREDLRERVQAYMRKAVREAKRTPAGSAPSSAYEDALARYVDGVLRPGQPSPFVDELQKFTARIAPFGFRNSLAQVALKFTVPGVPDVYQGCEQWNFSLVDPDNRRPVDFGKRRARWRPAGAVPGRLAHGRSLAAAAGQAADGRIKQLVTWRLLQLRRAGATCSATAATCRCRSKGTAAEHAVAFVRIHGGEAVLVVAARLTWTLCGGDDSALVARGLAAARTCGWPRMGDAAPLRALAQLAHRPGTAGCRATQPLDLDAVFAGAGGLPFAVLVAERTPAA